MTGTKKETEKTPGKTPEAPILHPPKKGPTTKPSGDEYDLPCSD